MASKGTPGTEPGSIPPGNDSNTSVSADQPATAGNYDVGDDPPEHVLFGGYHIPPAKDTR